MPIRTILVLSRPADVRLSKGTRHLTDLGIQILPSAPSSATVGTMRIVIVGNFGLNYKATMSARAIPIARELAQLGNSVTVLVPDDGASPRQPRVLSDTIRISELATPRLPSPLGHLWSGVHLTWRALRAQPDVLYAFKPKGYAGLALVVFWLLRHLGLMACTLVLDTDDWEGRGGWADYEQRSWLGRTLITIHERWCIQHSDLVTVASRALDQLAAQWQSNVLYLPNAASPASPGWHQGDGRQIRTQLGLGEQPVIIAYTRFVEFSPSRLLETFEAIHQDLPSTHLLVIGKGLNGEELYFRQLADERGLRDVVHVVGWIDPGDIPRYLAVASVAVYPLDDTLLNRTKCPMKLVDLLLAGVPVVADQVGQASEYVQEGTTGFLVCPGDVSALAERVVYLLRNESQRQAIGRAAREGILARWTWRSQANLVQNALAKLGDG